MYKKLTPIYDNHLEVLIYISNMYICPPECLILEGEAVAGWIQNPGVVVGAFNASVKPEGFSGEFSCVQGARVRQRAVGLALNITILLPFTEISERCQVSGLLHPLNNLEHGNKVDIISVDHLRDKLDQLLLESLVGLQPGGVEVQTEGSPVGAEMSVKVVTQHSTKLISVGNVGT